MSMLADRNEQQRFERLTQAIRPGSRLVRTWRLEGGVSAQVTAIEVERPDGCAEKLVVRQHGKADLTRNPDAARDEFRLLTVLYAAGLPVPRPIFTDQFGNGDSAPCVVIEYVDGSTDIPSSAIPGAVDQMATFLANLHAVGPASHDLSFLATLDERIDRLLHRPAGIPNAIPMLAALAARWPLAHRNAPVLLHGDFWPGNVIWNDGQIAAVLDWEDAILGDPLFDVASCRLELFWGFGFGAMVSFTEQYAAHRTLDFANLPFWELCAALGLMAKLSGWGLELEIEADMRAKLQDFASRALAQLQAS